MQQLGLKGSSVLSFRTLLKLVTTPQRVFQLVNKQDSSLAAIFLFVTETLEQKEAVTSTPSDEAQNFQELKQTDESPLANGESNPEPKVVANLDQSFSKLGQNFTCIICNKKLDHENGLYLHLIMFHYTVSIFIIF